MHVATHPNFIPLAEAARQTGSKPNVLRKHRVAKWEAQGLAIKDADGWRVSPDVLPTIRPVNAREHAESAAPLVGVEDAAACDQSHAENHVLTALTHVLQLRPIQWDLVIKLARMGKGATR